MSALNPQAHRVIEGAFTRFRDAVTPDDAATFQSTTLEDVHSSILDLEKQLALRKSLRNFRRVQPLLDSLKYFSQAIDVLCNGTPFLPWIWAPIKLMLQLTSEVPYALEKLITGYKQIAENLPRFDRLSATFASDKNFQRVLAVFYEDVLEFHRRAYKFVRRRGWAVFFKSAWNQFDRRFHAILKDLAYHAELVDKEATAVAIEQANDTRTRLLEQIEKTENERVTYTFDAVLSWLNAANLDQESEMDARTESCHPGSCEWIFKNSKMKGWIGQGHVNPVLWLHGKPGSGKTMLCSQIINTITSDEDAQSEKEKRERKMILYYFFSDDVSSNPNRNKCISLLRSLAAQILKGNRELAGEIYDSFISQGVQSNVKSLRLVLQTLLKACASTRIILDGLDECPEKEAMVVLRETSCLASCNAGSTLCKIMYSSRDVDPMAKSLATKAHISLGSEGQGLNAAINNFVKAKVSQLISSNLDGIELENDFPDYLEQQLVEKADGMFLWADLVLSVLEELYSVNEMKDCIETLPAGLEDLYERILYRWKDRPNVATAYRILLWLTYAHRPLKKHELQLGIGLHSQATSADVSESSRQSLKVFDLCKPLLEDGPNDTIRFVHTSVQQYLRKREDPMTSLRAGHFCIAFGCLTYLKIGMDLVDPAIAELAKYQALVKGYHTLAVYATEYWSAHLMESIRQMGDSTANHDEELLLERLRSMADKHDLLTGSCQVAENGRLNQSPEGLDRLKQLDVSPSVCLLVLHHLQIQEGMVEQKDSSKIVTEASGSTLFCSLRARYNEMIRNLLGTDSYEGVDKSALQSFKQNFTGSGFCCRFRTCPRAVFGFENANDLMSHEALHVMQLLCKHDDCQYSKIPFTNPRALKKHNEQFHEVAPAEIPRSLSRLDTAATLVYEPETALSPRSSDEQEIPYVLPDLGLPLNGVKDLDVEKDDGFAMRTTAWSTI